MKDNRSIINNIAIAFFEIAIEDQKVKEYYQIAWDLTKLFSEDNEIMSSFIFSSLSNEDFIKIIGESFKNKVPKIFINFLQYCVMVDMLSQINFILRKFVKLCTSHLDIKFGEAFTTIKIDSKKLELITKLIEKQLKGIHVHLLNKIDQKLIGGIKVVVSGNVWENSIVQKLEEAEKQFLI